MAPIAWTRLAGEQVETLLAILLACEDRYAQRVTPSQGDGGLDVIAPSPHTRKAYDVYQVKKFASALRSPQKSQIIKSLDRATETVQSGKLVIDTWYLTMPFDPSDKNLEWFRSISEGRPFKTHWHGLNYIESLVAKHPEVVDYYLDNGTARQEAKVSTLVTLLGASNSLPLGGVIDPADTMHIVDALRHAYASDPHYNFSLYFATRLPPVADDTIIYQERYDPLLRQWLRIEVSEKFRGAFNERPFAVSAVFDLDNFPELEADIALHERFGRPFSAPGESVTLEGIDLPGGLTPACTRSGTLTVGPRLSSKALSRGRLGLFSAQGSEHLLAEVEIDVHAHGTGIQGHTILCTEANQTFTLEWIFDREKREDSFSFRSLDWSGKRPKDIHSGLRFAKHLHEATWFCVGNQDGPWPTSGWGERYGDMKLRGWSAADYERALQYVEDLIEIQKATSAQVRTGPFHLLSQEVLDEVRRAATILREGVYTIPTGSVTMKGRAEFDLPVGQEIALCLHLPHKVDTGNGVVVVGSKHVSARSVQVTTRADGSTYVAEVSRSEPVLYLRDGSKCVLCNGTVSEEGAGRYMPILSR